MDEDFSCLCRHNDSLIAYAVIEIEMHTKRRELRSPTLLPANLIMSRASVLVICHFCMRNKDVGIVRVVIYSHSTFPL